MPAPVGTACLKQEVELKMSFSGGNMAKDKDIDQAIELFAKALGKREKKSVQSIINSIIEAGFTVNEKSFRSLWGTLDKINKADDIEVARNSNFIKDLIIVLKLLHAKPELQYVLLGEPIQVDPKRLLGIEKEDAEKKREEGEDIGESRGRKKTITAKEVEQLFKEYMQILRVANVLGQITSFKQAISERKVKDGMAVNLYNHCISFLDIILKELKTFNNIQNKTIINDCIEKAKRIATANKYAFLQINRPKNDYNLSDEELNFLTGVGVTGPKEKWNALCLPLLWTLYSVEIYIAVSFIFLAVDLFGVFQKYKVELAYGCYLQFKLRYYDVDQKKLKQVIACLRRHGNRLVQKDVFDVFEAMPRKKEGPVYEDEGYLNCVNIELVHSLEIVASWFKNVISQNNVCIDNKGRQYREIAIVKDLLIGLQVVENTFSNAIVGLTREYPAQEPNLLFAPGDSAGVPIPNFNFGAQMMDINAQAYYRNLWASKDTAPACDNNPAPQQPSEPGAPETEPELPSQEDCVPVSEPTTDTAPAEVQPVSQEVQEQNDGQGQPLEPEAEPKEPSLEPETAVADVMQQETETAVQEEPVLAQESEEESQQPQTIDLPISAPEEQKDTVQRIDDEALKAFLADAKTAAKEMKQILVEQVLPNCSEFKLQQDVFATKCLYCHETFLEGPARCPICGAATFNYRRIDRDVDLSLPEYRDKVIHLMCKNGSGAWFRDTLCQVKRNGIMVWFNDMSTVARARRDDGLEIWVSDLDQITKVVLPGNEDKNNFEETDGAA